jgi:hypothetical protein
MRSVYSTDAIFEIWPEVYRLPNLSWNWGATRQKLDIGTVNLLRSKHIQDLMNTSYASDKRQFMCEIIKYLLCYHICTPLKPFLKHMI